MTAAASYSVELFYYIYTEYYCLCLMEFWSRCYIANIKFSQGMQIIAASYCFVFFSSISLLFALYIVLGGLCVH